MNHHLAEKAREKMKRHLEEKAKARLQELNSMMRILALFEKEIGDVEKAAAYFDVSVTIWLAWRCGEQIPPAAACFHIARLGRMIEKSMRNAGVTTSV